MEVRPLIGITMGDAAGVSPELILKALGNPDIYEQCRPVVIGDTRVLEAAKTFVNSQVNIRSIDDVGEGQYEVGTIDVLNQRNLDPSDYELGKVNASCGEAAVHYIRKAARLALDGKLDAIASAPVNKEAMNAAGHHYPGQTEIFAEVEGASTYFTILTGGKMKVFLVTSHMSLRNSIDHIRQERVEKVIRVAHKSLQELWAIKEPRLAVAGLNPHAGDGGLFGNEEIEEIIPAIRQCREAGIDVGGPYPSDSLFYQAEQGYYDGVLAMYHDQGVIPLKRYGYVTVISGTKLIRTTAGHGTAYDIAGKGIVREDVFARAILLAASLVESRTNQLA
jgi:4-phospho-D-threonate 3-dehydrogenase / 4-phospho-D-erythronate 3-dehydrogenase